MDLNEKTEELLQQQCYIVDILPVTVPKEGGGQYFEIEAFYLSNHIEALFRDFADILLKLNCYFTFSISWDEAENWLINPSPQLFHHRMVACSTDKTCLKIVIEKENTLIFLDGNDLYFTIYNPSEKIKQLLSPLCSAKGLFFRQALNGDIHDHIAHDFLTNKSVSSFLWLLDKGREIEFSYKGKQYFVSKSNSCSYVSLWEGDSEQGFPCAKMLWEGAEIGGEKLSKIWHDVVIDTLF